MGRLIGFIFLLIPFNAISQPIYYPLVNTLQQEFDSSIVFFPRSNWDMSPNFFILSKKNGKITAARYARPPRHPIRRKTLDPDSLRQLQVDDSLYDVFMWTNPAVNQFYVQQHLADSTLNRIWEYATAQDMFRARDDHDFGHGCSGIDSTNKCYVFDAGEKTFYMISKTYCKYLLYYAPDFFEKRCCPGVKERQAVNNLSAMMYKAFGTYR